MLKLEIDQPIQAKLLKQHPEQRSGKFGTEQVYTLEVDGEVTEFRATENVHGAIQSKILEGQVFELVKRRHSDNPTHTVIWVNVLEPGDEYFEQPTPFGESDSILKEIRNDIKYIKGWVERQGNPKPRQGNPSKPFDDDDDIPF